MKNNNNLVRREKKSFQSQLFFIVLVIFVLFIFAEYLIVDYVLSSEYLKTERDYNLDSISELKESIDGGGDLYSLLSSYDNNSDSTPLVIDATGGISLKRSTYTSYSITVTGGYSIIIPDYNFMINEGDTISEIYFESFDDTYTATHISYNGNEYINNSLENSEKLEDVTVLKVKRPENINYLYKDNNNVQSDIDNARSNIKKFKDSEIDGIKYYSDSLSSKLYFTLESEKIENGFILIIASTVETKSLSKVVSSYYGYIILVSVIIAVLVALFISRAFSLPIKQIEREMKKLSSGDYEKSNFEFTNSELVSLQDTLNIVKEETKERVDLLEDQKNELSKMNKRILSEEELRKSFIARLSHELKTPLMVISATTEALMDNMIDEKDKNAEYNNILNEIEKSNSIIKNIIESYKSSSRKYKLTKERFNLSELVKEAIKPLGQLLETNHEFKVSLDETIYISADRNLLLEVISNYLTNAIKYTKEGSKIEVNLKEDSDSILFEVKNYGSKISKENLEKIWLPFFREKENVESTSTGMGLYIVKEILEAHKFEYNVTNFKGGVVSFFKIKK